ncbi:hypothetical protein CTAYLR_002061 [Chrysophaeum taylorii]|uniref:RRM domain-containing protein n=1 Tax=Chrysophaeum taylorii TaxID=2483200 RepID=A0AAD7XRA0_9STRA|nr:hypothetical protein CTAYLR_002061 [Chrysophaeum taylorii]
MAEAYDAGDIAAAIRRQASSEAVPALSELFSRPSKPLDKAALFAIFKEDAGEEEEVEEEEAEVTKAAPPVKPRRHAEPLVVATAELAARHEKKQKSGDLEMKEGAVEPTTSKATASAGADEPEEKTEVARVEEPKKRTRIAEGDADQDMKKKKKKKKEKKKPARNEEIASSEAEPEQKKKPARNEEIASSEAEPEQKKKTARNEEIASSEAEQKKMKKKKKASEPEETKKTARNEAEQKVSSEAEQKKKRSAGDDSERKDGEEEKEASLRTVFVGNLPKETKRKAVEKFFARYGKVESARIRSLPTAGAKVDDAGNQDLVRRVCAYRGSLTDAKPVANAYVVYESVDAAKRAVDEANGREFGSFHLRVDWAKRSRDKTDHLRTAFVGNLPRGTDEESLRAHFASHVGGHEAIHNVRVVRNREDHAAIGVAYVLLKDPSLLSTALELDGHPPAGSAPRRTTRRLLRRERKRNSPELPVASRRKESLPPKVVAAAAATLRPGWGDVPPTTRRRDAIPQRNERRRRRRRLRRPAERK